MWEFVMQVSAAIAGPAAIGALGYAWRTWKDVHETTERNEIANYGSDDPHNPWPGTVPLTVDHERRLQELEDELGVEPPSVENLNRDRFMADGAGREHRTKWQRLREWIRRRLRGKS